MLSINQSFLRILFFWLLLLPSAHAFETPNCYLGLIQQKSAFCLNSYVLLSNYIDAPAGFLKPTQSNHSKYSFQRISVYSAFHYSEILSAHLIGNLENRHIAGIDYQNSHNQALDAAFIQLGNSYNLKALSLISGLIDTSFGLNYSPISHSLALYKDESFWLPQSQASRLTITSNLRTQLELSVAHKFSEQWRSYERFPAKTANSVRISRDIAALEGTKLIFSAMLQTDNSKSFGFASLNKNPSSTTSFEWVRRYSPSHSFDQIFRLNYLGSWRENNKWILEYESERNRAWMATIGLNGKLTHTVTWQIETAYRSFPIKQEADRAILNTSLELKI